VFNRITHPPKKEGICDICGGELIQRDDDLRSAIEQRLKTYHKKTQPLINFYKKEGLLIEINGQQDIDKVFKDIKEKIGNN
jgi:adenylate kinase